MQKFALAVTLVFAFLIIGIPAQALKIRPKSLEFTIEQGHQQTFLIHLFDLNESVKLTTTGEISDWIKIIDPLLVDTINKKEGIYRIVIEVPSTASIGQKEGNIIAKGNSTKETASIKVRVTLTRSKIKTLQSLAEVGKKIDTLRSTLEDLVSSRTEQIQSSISGQIRRLFEQEQQIEKLEQERNSLENRAQQLEKKVSILESNQAKLKNQKNELQKLTGELSARQPSLFSLGLVCGALAVLAFFKRKKIIGIIQKIRRSKFKY